MLDTAKDLSEQQQEAIDFIYARDYSLLLAGTGTGKTIISLTAISELLADEHINKVLIITPAKVVSNWLKENDKWGLNLSIVGGTGNKFITQITTEHNIVVTSYESSPKILDSFKFDAVIFDEITRLKETGGVIARTINRYKKQFKWKLGLSATPLSESWEAVYGISKVLDNGERFGRNKEHFYREYFNQLDYKGYNWEIKSEKIDEITQKFYQFTYLIDEAVKRQEMIKPKYLPDIKFTASNKIKELEIELIQDNLIEVNGTTIVAENAAVLSGKLRQLAQGFIIDEDEQIHWIDKYRIELAIKHIKKKLKDNSLIVTYEYSCICDKLRSHFPKANVINGNTSKKEFDNIMIKWRNGSGKLLFLQVRAGSHGLDGLQMSSHQMLHFAPIWSRDATLQLEGRLDRTGQKEQVEIQTLIGSNTIDIEVANRVELKGLVFEDFLNRISG